MDGVCVLGLKEKAERGGNENWSVCWKLGIAA